MCSLFVLSENNNSNNKCKLYERRKQLVSDKSGSQLNSHNSLNFQTANIYVQLIYTWPRDVHYVLGRMAKILMPSILTTVQINVSMMYDS